MTAFQHNVAQQGDALALLRSLQDNCSPLVFFDPQYRETLDRLAYGNEGERQRARSELPAMSTDYIDACCRETARVLRPSGYLVLWADDYRLGEGYHQRFADVLKLTSFCAWDCGRMGMGYRFRNRGDYVLALQRPPLIAKATWRDHGIGTRWREKVDRSFHPHVKPFGLIERLIGAVTEPGDLVVDPAAGSFMVLLAALQTKRRFIGCDAAYETPALCKRAELWDQWLKFWDGNGPEPDEPLSTKLPLTFAPCQSRKLPNRRNQRRRKMDMDDEPNLPDEESVTPKRPDEKPNLPDEESVTPKRPGEEPSDEVPDVLNFPASPADAGVTPELSAALDEDEAMLKRLTGGMPDVGEAGPGSLGVIAVDKVPTGKNAFFRAHPGIILKNVSLTVDEAGMGKAFYVVDPAMEKAVESIGIRVAKHTLYLTLTQPPISVLTIVPVRSEDPIDDYSRTKEMVLLEAMTGWVRIYTDLKQRIYRSYPAPEDRFDEPKWPDLAPAKIFRMTFKDRGRLLDSVQHPAWKRWTGQ